MSNDFIKEQVRKVCLTYDLALREMCLKTLELANQEKHNLYFCYKAELLDKLFAEYDQRRFS